MTGDCDLVPEWAESPSPLESAYYYYGLDVALQARTVARDHRVQPADCASPFSEDLLAPWPWEDSYNLDTLSPESAKLGIIKQACYLRHQAIMDTRSSLNWVSYFGWVNHLQEYQQKYLPLIESEHAAVLPQREPAAVLSQLWCQSQKSQTGLVPELAEALLGVPVLKLLLARIQMGTFRNAPVKTVVLVDMAMDDFLPQRESLQFAYKCKAVLVRHGISDIEVEVRALPQRSLELHSELLYPGDVPAGEIQEDRHDHQSQVHPAQALQLLKQKRLDCFQEIEARGTQIDRRIKTRMLEALRNPSFSSIFRDIGTMGLRISTFESQGTMGPIIRLIRNDQHDERMLGLTCFHVVRRPDPQIGHWPPLFRTYLQTEQDQGQSFRDMWLFNSYHFSRLRGSHAKSLSNAISEVEQHINRESRHLLRQAENETSEDRQDQLYEQVNAIEQQRDMVQMLEELRDAVPADCPRLGSVFATGAYGTVTELGPENTGQDPKFFMPDWALINIDPNFAAAISDTRREPAPWLTWPNRLRLVAPNDLERSWSEAARDDPQHCSNSRIDDPESDRHCFYKVSGISKSFRSDVPQTVFKHGATTGFTKGETLGALAILPRASPDDTGKATWTTEIVVVMEGTSPFSQGGDSGAAVLDSDCRVVGMLVSGVVPTDLVQKIEDKKKRKEQAGKAKAQAQDEQAEDYSAEGHDAHSGSDGPEESDLEDMDKTEDQVRGRKWFDANVAEKWPQDPKNWLLSEMQQRKNQDLTFVTPIELILEDIQQVTGQRAEVL
ncbi:hypothetical protein LIA77_04623 [Sarocladium implicatum]|nr:hypothetical protein LIA77_04623 [Sarocladium implicatum]